MSTLAFLNSNVCKIGIFTSRIGRYLTFPIQAFFHFIFEGNYRINLTISTLQLFLYYKISKCLKFRCNFTITFQAHDVNWTKITPNPISLNVNEYISTLVLLSYHILQ